VTEVAGQRVFNLQLLQGRNPDWVCRPFFAKYDPKAIWLDDLYPAFGKQQFFFENEYPIHRSNKIASSGLREEALN
ncbi:MAG: lysine 2,3-aminomutase, partial [Bacteroidetes bacterium]|nr:lysine 2,3-aminomutase [Bacteroidota bacterium]